MNWRGLLCLIVVCAVAIPSVAQDLSDYQKVLLPVFASKSVPGAGGSRFLTVLRGYTEVDTSYYASVPAGDTTRTPAFMIQRAFSQTFEALNYGPAAPTGRFLYIDKARLSELSLQYFLVSVVSAGSPALSFEEFTALPVVIIPLSGMSRMLSVPVTPIITYDPTGVFGTLAGYRERNKLRVYDFNGDGSGEVLVEGFDERFFGRAGKFVSATLKLDKRGGDDPTFPYYGEIDLNHCIPFGSTHTPCVPYSFRLEITPRTSNVLYWGFVTSTDNQTQHVTIFEPQRKMP